MRPVIVGTLLLGCIPSLGLTQAFGIGPSFGYYHPFSNFAPASVYATDLPTSPSQLAAPSWGLDAYLGLGARWRLNGFFSTASGSIPAVATPGGGGATPTQARVTLAALEAQYGIVQFSAGSLLLVSAGVATIQHGGEGYSRYGSPRAWGGIVGLEFEHAVSRHLQLTAGVRGLSYAFDLNFPPQHGGQFDGMFTVGMRWCRQGSGPSPH